jgi:hypothetical protein
MTSVVQHETKGAREDRMKRCTHILAGDLRSVAFVRDLDLHNLQLGDARMADVFARLAEVESIERLAIGFNILRRDAMTALCESPLSARLVELDLTGNHLGDAGIAALVAGRFPRLGRLGLAWGRLEDSAAAALADAAGMPALRDLSLRRNDLTDEGAFVLAASERLRAQLERLDIDCNDEVTRRGMTAVRRAFGSTLVS